MNNEIIEATYKLKNAIKEMEKEVSLSQKEKNMEQNEEVMILSYRFDSAQTKYNDALKYFESNSNEVKMAQKELFEAKKALDTHPAVKEYVVAYSYIRKAYDKIQKEIFDNFKIKSCNEKR